jgi:hypothetical protein
MIVSLDLASAGALALFGVIQTVEGYSMSVLGLSNNGGGGKYIRFMPSVNSWVADKEEIELKQFVMDHGSVKSGWGLMAEGQAPQWIWDERLGVQGKRPEGDYKRGFSIRLFIKDVGVVEWSSTGTGPVMGFEVIFEEIWNAKDKNAGKVPVIKYAGSEALKIGKGNTRKPKFELVKWVDRDSIAWDAEAPAAEEAKVEGPAIDSDDF